MLYKTTKCLYTVTATKRSIFGIKKSYVLTKTPSELLVQVFFVCIEWSHTKFGIISALWKRLESIQTSFFKIATEYYIA